MMTKEKYEEYLKGAKARMDSSLAELESTKPPGNGVSAGEVLGESKSAWKGAYPQIREAVKSVFSVKKPETEKPIHAVTGPTEKPWDENEFRNWYAELSYKNNLNPDPDAPEQPYNYRIAHYYGAKPDETGQFPSIFMSDKNPNRFILDASTGNAYDVKNNKVVSWDEVVEARYPGVLSEKPEDYHKPGLVKALKKGFEKYTEEERKASEEAKGKLIDIKHGPNIFSGINPEDLTPGEQRAMYTIRALLTVPFFGQYRAVAPGAFEHKKDVTLKEYEEGILRTAKIGKNGEIDENTKKSLKELQEFMSNNQLNYDSKIDVNVPTEPTDEFAGVMAGATELGGDILTTFALGHAIVARIPTIFKEGAMMGKWAQIGMKGESIGRQAATLSIAMGMKAQGGKTVGEEIDLKVRAALQGAVTGGLFGSVGEAAKLFPTTFSRQAINVFGMSMITGIPASLRGASTTEQAYEYLLGTYFGVKSGISQERIQSLRYANKHLINKYRQEYEDYAIKEQKVLSQLGEIQKQRKEAEKEKVKTKLAEEITRAGEIQTGERKQALIKEETGYLEAKKRGGGILLGKEEHIDFNEMLNKLKINPADYTKDEWVKLLKENGIDVNPDYVDYHINSIADAIANGKSVKANVIRSYGEQQAFKEANVERNIKQFEEPKPGQLGFKGGPLEVTEPVKEEITKTPEEKYPPNTVFMVREGDFYRDSLGKITAIHNISKRLQELEDKGNKVIFTDVMPKAEKKGEVYAKGIGNKAPVESEEARLKREKKEGVPLRGTTEVGVETKPEAKVPEKAPATVKTEEIPAPIKEEKPAVPVEGKVPVEKEPAIKPTKEKPTKKEATVEKEPWEMTKKEWVGEKAYIEINNVSNNELKVIKIEFEGIDAEAKANEFIKSRGLEDGDYNIGRISTGRGENKIIESVHIDIMPYGNDVIMQRIYGPFFKHKQQIENALKEGKNVPQEVLRDYADLAEKYGKGKPAVKPAEEKPAVKPEVAVEEKPDISKLKTYEGVKLINPKSIKTNTDLFQPRFNDFSQETYDRITREGWDLSKQDPIIVWIETESGDMVCVEGNTRRKWADDNNIEEVKIEIMEGSLEEAILRAEQSNERSTKEKLGERLNKLIKQRKRGVSEKDIKNTFGTDYDRLNNLSYLDSQGKFMQMLLNKDKGESTHRYIIENAIKAGELRKKYPDKLTDSHEAEMFDFFYTDEGSKFNNRMSKEEFFHMVEDKINVIDWNPERKLLLSRTKESKTGLKARADAQKIMEEIKELEEHRDKSEKPDEIKNTQDKIDRLYYGYEIVDKKGNTVHIPGLVDLDKAQTSLFGEETPINEVKIEEKSIDEYSDAMLEIAKNEGLDKALDNIAEIYSKGEISDRVKSEIEDAVKFNYNNYKAEIEAQKEIKPIVTDKLDETINEIENKIDELRGYFKSQGFTDEQINRLINGESDLPKPQEGAEMGPEFAEKIKKLQELKKQHYALLEAKKRLAESKGEKPPEISKLSDILKPQSQTPEISKIDIENLQSTIDKLKDEINSIPKDTPQKEKLRAQLIENNIKLSNLLKKLGKGEENVKSKEKRDREAEKRAGYATTRGGGAISVGKIEGGIERQFINVRPEETKAPKANQVNPSFAAVLMPHQITDVNRAIEALDETGGYLNSNGTGTGKTMEIIVICQHYVNKFNKPVVIVTDNDRVVKTAFLPDADKLGIQINYEKESGKIFDNMINVTYYGRVREGILKGYEKGDISLVIFDESHRLNDINSQQSAACLRLMNTVKRIAYFSATPLDEIKNLWYLRHLGLYDENADFYDKNNPESFVSLINRLGYEYVIQKKGKPYYRRNPYMTAEETAEKIDEMFSDLTSNGNYSKVELGWNNAKINMLDVELSPENIRYLNLIEEHYNEKSANASGPAKGYYIGQKVMMSRLFLEQFKIDEALRQLDIEHAKGRKTIISMDRINDSEVSEKDEFGKNIIAQSKGTMIEMLEKIFGTYGKEKVGILAGQNIILSDGTRIKMNDKIRENVINDFQAGKYDILVMTTQTGGIGLSLDDVKGGEPRSLIVLNLPWSAIKTFQLFGRINRLTTKSDTQIISLFANCPQENHLKDIVNVKFKVLGAAVQGKANELKINELRKIDNIPSFYDNEILLNPTTNVPDPEYIRTLAEKIRDMKLNIRRFELIISKAKDESVKGDFIKAKEAGERALLKNKKERDALIEKYGEAIKEYFKNVPPGSGQIGKAREGMDVGGYLYLDKAFLDLPEIIELAKYITEGKVKISKKSSILGEMPLGICIQGSEGITIHLSHDLIKTDVELAKATAAHEAFHGVNALPDYIKKRGHIFNHIAALQDYMKKSIAILKNSGAIPFTKEDYQDMRSRAKKETTPLVKHLKGAERAKERSRIEKELYENIREEEAEKRGLITYQSVMKELNDLTDFWKPYDKDADADFTKYRQLPSELFADFGSVLLNKPELLDILCPKTKEFFFNYAENRKEFRDVFNKIRERIIDSKFAVQEERYQKMISNFNKPIDKAPEEEQAGVVSEIYSAFMENIATKYYYGEAALRKALKEGYSPKMGENLRNLLEEIPYINDQVYKLLANIQNNIRSPLRFKDITDAEIGALFYFKRVGEGDRMEIFNPEGHTAKTAMEVLEHMRNKFGDEDFNYMVDLAKKVWEYRKEYIIDPIVKNKHYNEELNKKLQINEHYATFNLIKYLEKKFTGGTVEGIYSPVKKQWGTVGEITNPFHETVFKDIDLIWFNHMNLTKRVLIETLRAGGAKIEDAERRWTGKRLEFLKPKEPNKGLIVYLENGEGKGYYIDSKYTRMFKKQVINNQKIVNGLLEPMRWFKAGYVSYNPGWVLRNPIRDMFGAMVRLPGWKPIYEIPYLMIKNWGAARKFVYWNEIPKIIEEMLENKAILLQRGYRASDIPTTEDELNTMIGNAFNEPHKDYFDNCLKPMQRWVRILSIGRAGQFGEKLTKIASYEYLKKNYPDMPKDEMAHMVRKLAGSPDFNARGRAYLLTNNIWMFSNAGVQGLRSMIEASQHDKVAFWTKFATLNLGPKVFMWSLKYGLASAFFNWLSSKFRDEHKFDKAREYCDWMQCAYNKISTYDLRHYTCLPIGEGSNSKPIYLKLPYDFQGEIVAAVLWDLLEGGEFGTADKIKQDIMNGIPWNQINPVISLSVDLFKSWANIVPRNNWSGNPIMTDLEWESGGSIRNLALAKGLWNKYGATWIYRFPYAEMDQNRSLIEKMLDTPMAGGTAKYFIKVSDQGIYDDLMDIKAEDTKYEARQDEAVRKEIRKHFKIMNAKPSKEDAKILFDKLRSEGIVPGYMSPGAFMNRYISIAKAHSDVNRNLYDAMKGVPNRTRAKMLESYYGIPFTEVAAAREFKEMESLITENK